MFLRGDANTNGTVDVSDAVFVLNTAIHFNVGYVDGEGTKVMNLELIRPRYLRSLDFGFDLLGCLPLDVLQLGLGWRF